MGNAEIKWFLIVNNPSVATLLLHCITSACIWNGMSVRVNLNILKYITISHILGMLCYAYERVNGNKTSITKIVYSYLQDNVFIIYCEMS